MKKLILSMVFVFAFVAVTPTSASNKLSSITTDSVAYDCIMGVFDLEERLGITFTYDEFNWLVTWCESQQSQ